MDWKMDILNGLVLFSHLLGEVSVGGSSNDLR